MEFKVAVKRAKSMEEMGEPVPGPERTAERLPRAEIAGGGTAEKKRRAKGDEESFPSPASLREGGAGARLMRLLLRGEECSRGAKVLHELRH